MTLMKISIENIKGISAKTFELKILPNKPSLLVAPNGFGKSSLAAAFSSLQQNKLSLEKDSFHKNDEKLDPKLVIEYEDHQKDIHLLIATPKDNTISKHFSWFVINNQLKAKGIGRNFGGKSLVSADIIVNSVVLIDTIPQKVYFSYSYADQKELFGINGKILPSISKYFRDLSFVASLNKHYSDFDRISQTRNQEKITDIISSINQQQGTKQELTNWIEKHCIPMVLTIEPLYNFINYIIDSNVDINDFVTSFLVAIQIYREYSNDKEKFKKAVKYSEYELEKRDYKELLRVFNTSWCSISPKESKSKLIVEFPKSNQISNGQRDVITFIAMLQRAQKKLKNKNAILIIDEVFDYLDDANLIAVQYYITKFIQKFKDNGQLLYPLILTHLNPFFFKNFAFKDQKVYFLDKRDSKPNQSMVNLLKKRDDNLIKDDVSKYLLHYHPEKINRRSDFKNLGLRETWGEGNHFRDFINDEVKKYVNEALEFDPLAVCCAVRLVVEKYAYDQLTHEDDRQRFINTFKTREKLVYAEECGALIPEYFYLLGIIYNEAMHWKNNQDILSPIVSKLDNQTIRYIIKEVISLLQ